MTAAWSREGPASVTTTPRSLAGSDWAAWAAESWRIWAALVSRSWVGSADWTGVRHRYAAAQRTVTSERGRIRRDYKNQRPIASGTEWLVQSPKSKVQSRGGGRARRGKQYWPFVT